MLVGGMMYDPVAELRGRLQRSRWVFFMRPCDNLIVVVVMK